MSRFKIALATVILTLLAAAWAQATTLVYLSVEDLAELSNDVVIGRVVESSSYIDGDGQTIFTAVTLEVFETIKGEVATQDRIVLHHIGGEVNGIALRYASMPTFRVNQNVAVFLRRLGEHDFALVGLGQGVMQVRQEDGVWRAYRDLSSMRFINPEFPGRSPVEEQHGNETYTLGELRSRLEESETRPLLRR